MQQATVEVWECADCRSAVSAQALFASCDGRHCAARLFAVECRGCAAPLRTSCVEERGGPAAHPLCGRCAKDAAKRWG